MFASVARAQEAPRAAEPSQLKGLRQKLWPRMNRLDSQEKWAREWQVRLAAARMWARVLWRFPSQSKSVEARQAPLSAAQRQAAPGRA